MSGHSKWSTIKRKKGAKDAARGKLFSKLAKDILVAAQQGGPDPDMNFSLRLAIERAKSANMPSDNIKRALDKASGSSKGDAMVELVYEVYGPGGSMLLVDCKTDNSNRALTELKSVLNSTGAKLASEGSISWQFDVYGLIIISPLKAKEQTKYGQDTEYRELNIDELQLELMEHEGVEDISIEDGKINLFCDIKTLQQLRDDVMKTGVKVEEASVVKIAQNEVNLEAEDMRKLENLEEALSELDDVDNVWTNVN